MKTLLILAAISIGLSIFIDSKSMAYLVSEVEPGIVEIRGTQKGSLVSSQVHVDKKKHWIYVEVKEGQDVRYFYAPYRDFSNLAGKKKLQAIQYGIGHRIFNTKGKIPFGPQKYFYPLVEFKAAT